MPDFDSTEHLDDEPTPPPHRRLPCAGLHGRLGLSARLRGDRLRARRARRRACPARRRVIARGRRRSTRRPGQRLP